MAMVAWQNGSGRERGDAPGGAAVRRRRLRNALIGIVVVVIVALASLWSARRPIASNVLANEMEKRGEKKGLATLCIGGGKGIAMCIER